MKREDKVLLILLILSMVSHFVTAQVDNQFQYNWLKPQTFDENIDVKDTVKSNIITNPNINISREGIYLDSGHFMLRAGFNNRYHTTRNRHGIHMLTTPGGGDTASFIINGRYPTFFQHVTNINPFTFRFLDSSFTVPFEIYKDSVLLRGDRMYNREEVNNLINFNNVFQASPEFSIIETLNPRSIDYNNYFEFDAAQGMWMSAGNNSTILELNTGSWSLYENTGAGLNTYDPNHISVKPSGDNFEGIVYSSDHSSEFTDRSLVDKGYTLDVNNTGEVKTTSIDYTTTDDDFLILADTDSQNVTIELHTPLRNQILHFKKTSPNNSLFINVTTGSDIDGNASVTLTNNYESLTIMWNGTNWSVL